MKMSKCQDSLGGLIRGTSTRISAFEGVIRPLSAAAQAIKNVIGDQPSDPRFPSMDTVGRTMDELTSQFSRLQGQYLAGPTVDPSQTIRDVIQQFEVEIQKGKQSYPQQAQVFDQASALVAQARNNLESGQQNLPRP